MRTVRNKYMNYFSKGFFLYITLPPTDQCQVPIIRFVLKALHQTLVNFSVSSPGYWQTGCLWWEAVESWFHLDLKSVFALNNNSMGFLLSHITGWINVIHESWMKWTWHHSKFAIHEVSFHHRLRLVAPGNPTLWRGVPVTPGTPLPAVGSGAPVRSIEKTTGSLHLPY